jgi:hypothetical protein
MNPRKTFLLRISPALYELLEAWAQQEMRSVNGQIEYLLREALQKRGRSIGEIADEAADETADEPTLGTSRRPSAE